MNEYYFKPALGVLKGMGGWWNRVGDDGVYIQCRRIGETEESLPVGNGPPVFKLVFNWVYCLPENGFQACFKLV
jgi:hypothetical protein